MGWQALPTQLNEFPGEQLLAQAGVHKREALHAFACESALSDFDRKSE
jgi:hypothetical protein